MECIGDGLLGFGGRMVKRIKINKKRGILLLLWSIGLGIVPT